MQQFQFILFCNLVIDKLHWGTYHNSDFEELNDHLVFESNQYQSSRTSTFYTFS